MTILTLGSEGTVHTANIGDSGYAWIRKNKNGSIELLFKSQEQQHSFNFPYQLMAPNSPYAEGDSPSLSIKNKHHAQNLDYFIVGSDGLFDNIYLQEIIQDIERLWQHDSEGVLINNNQIADHLAHKAIKYG